MRQSWLFVLSAWTFITSASMGAAHIPVEGQPRRIPPDLLKRFAADGDGKLSPAEGAKLREALPRRPGANPGRPPRPGHQRLPEGMNVQGDLAYGPGGPRHTLDLYVPEKSDKPLPLAIWIHGGAWAAGSKENCRALPLLEHGSAVASINYRLTDTAQFPAHIEDCKAAVRFLRKQAAQYRLDPAHFGVWGSSAGGHLGALLGTSGDVKALEGDVGEYDDVSSRVQAVCDWFGPTDLSKMGGSHDAASSPESKLVGGLVQERRDQVAAANPITHVTKDDPPFLIMHGTRDPAVPFNQSELLEAALHQTGVESTLVPLDGAGHGGGEFEAPDTQSMIREFFDQHLKSSP